MYMYQCGKFCKTHCITNKIKCQGNITPIPLRCGLTSSFGKGKNLKDRYQSVSVLAFGKATGNVRGGGGEQGLTARGGVRGIHCLNCSLCELLKYSFCKNGFKKFCNVTRKQRQLD